MELLHLPPAARVVNLGGNRLQGGVGLTGLPAPGLTHLSLEQNQLEGEVVLGGLPQGMEYLILGSNRLEGGVDLRNLPTSLLALCLEENRLSGEVRFDRLPPRLEHLYLDGNVELWGIVKEELLPPSLTTGLHVDDTKITDGTEE